MSPDLARVGTPTLQFQMPQRYQFSKKRFGKLWTCVPVTVPGNGCFLSLNNISVGGVEGSGGSLREEAQWRRYLRR